MKRGYLILLLLLVRITVWPQTRTLSLERTIDLAREQSVAARKAYTVKVTRYWEWRAFKSNYRPSITWSGQAPGFSRTSKEVIQPDGTVRFQSISQNNYISQVSLSQPIAFTGGALFIGTYLQRFDDLNQDNTLYNGIPLQLGISQPIFAYNPLKWDKRIEPLRYRESQQAYVANMEEVGVTALDYFFNLQIAQIDYAIAATNVANTDTIFRITSEKYDLGKVSRNDLLQLKLEKLKAAKALAQAQQDLKTAELDLGSYIGFRDLTDVRLVLPENIREVDVREETALKEALENRPEAISFARRDLEAEKEVAQAKGSTGFSAGLTGTLGFAKTGDRIGDIYRNPPDQQTLSLTFNFPIVDWGRSRSQLETARANQQLALTEIEQDRINFEQQLLTEVGRFHRFYTQVDLNREVDELAQDRYQIAQDRFIAGNLGITELVIALQEKDRAKRDYVLSLRDYWRSYYLVRLFTLYDFEKAQKLK